MPIARSLRALVVIAVAVAALALPTVVRAADPDSAAAGETTRLLQLERQRVAAFAIKRDAIWTGARNHFREAREVRELALRARRGDARARRALKLRRIGEDEGPVVREALPAWALRAPHPTAANATAPANVRCNDPSTDAAGAAQSEVSVAAAGDQVVVAWNDGQGFNVPGGDLQGYAWSADGGATFHRGGAPPHPPAYSGFRWTSDPVLTANERTGDFWYCGLANPDALHNAIAVAHGRFTAGTFAFDSVWTVRVADNATLFLDKQWIACDPASGALYVTNTTFGASDTIDFQRSTDGGRTWSSPVTLSSATDAGNVQGSRVAVGPAGEVLTAWYAADAFTIEDDIRFRRSTDGGRSFGAETTPVKFDAQFGTGAPGFNRERGITFPSLAVDRSDGAHRGRVYLAWAESWRFLGVALPAPGSTSRGEIEANNTSATATTFAAGQTLRGTLAPASGVADQDWWACPLAAGQSLVVEADSVGANPWYLRLLAPDGAQRLCYGGNPSGAGANLAYFTFTAPVSGTYFLRMIAVTTGVTGYRIRTALGGNTGERSRDQRDAFVAWSDDGATWSAPVRINDDAPGFDQFLPEVATGGDGAVYAVWYDHRDEAHGSMANVEIARSTDGGATWSANRALTSALSNFTTSASNIAPNMGDYIHLAVSGSKIHPAWGDGRSTSSIDVWSASIDAGANIAASPPDTSMSAPGTATFGWSLAAGSSLFTNAVTVTLSSDRDWPLPPPATIALGGGVGGSALWWTADVTVPDSAASGPNHLCLTLASPSGATLARSCFTVNAIGLALAVGDDPARGLALAPCRPNPAPGRAVLAWTLPRAGRVRLVIYDLAGARVRTLVDGERPAGEGRAEWDGRDDRGATVGAGAYFYRIEFGGAALSKRLVMVR